MIEDIKGYKPHTDDKIGKVNAIKDAEVRLGLIFKALEDEIIEEYNRLANSSSTPEEELEPVLFASDCLSKAKDRLKEASMWACRGVFRPEEKY